MATSIGSVGEFVPDLEDWTQYAERLGHYLTANGIDEVDRKKAVLLTTIGAKAYKLLRTLVSPEKPGDKTYDELVAAMQQHHSPKPSPIVQRYRFNSRLRREGESVAQYLSELRALSEFCDFGPSLDNMLRDRLVCGVGDQTIQRKLLAEEGLTLKRATDIALAMETAARNAATLQGAGAGGDDSELAVHQVQPRAPSTTSNRSFAPPASGACYRCGAVDHFASKCGHKDSKCFRCGKIGHLARVCRSRNKRSSQQPQPLNVVRHTNQGSQSPKLVEEGQEDEYAMCYMSPVSPRKPHPMQVFVEMNGQPISMEVDTGASVSIISETEHRRHLPGVPVHRSPIQLRTYTGEPLKVVGGTTVDVVYGQQRARLPLVVVAGEGPCLMRRDWLQHLRLDWRATCTIQLSPLQEVLEQHAEVFREELGTLKDYKAVIQVDASIPPKFCKARAVPYALRAKVDQELDRLVEEGILEPVQYAEWAASIVPVVKSDQSVRICGDFKQTVNAASRVDRYPLPKVEDLFATLYGGRIFSKLDLSQAYQQVLLEDVSRDLVTINTQKGLFRYTRLPFGVSSAPGIFQRVMEEVLQGIPNVVVYLDDILAASTSEEEHVKLLDAILSRIQAAGLQLRKSKCTFGVSSVTYLGHKIDAEGLHPVPEKVQAVQDAPSPTDVAQLRSYLGLLSFYSRLLPQLSIVIAPLNHLLRASQPWKWTRVEEQAFQASKQLLLSSRVLMHFNPELDVILSCDASAYGLGAVLSHRLPDGTEQPIAFASRTLTPTEKKYAQIEKEGLACVFGVKRFHSYLFGRLFTLVTDHKPLVSLFEERRAIPAHASARIQRWALTLTAYQYVLGFRTSAQNANADAMSRLPLPGPAREPPIPAETVMLLDHLNASPVTAAQIRSWTTQDPVLARVLRLIQEGWPSVCEKELQSFTSRHTELSVQDGYILWGNRVVLPRPGRQQILEELHAGHPGIARIKSLARMFVWWPQMDNDIEMMVKGYLECQQSQPVPAKAPLHPWEWPSKPWSRLHVDFAGPVQGHMLLILIDAYSKWIEAFAVKSTTSSVVIQCLRSVFARFGLPDTLISDNATYFVSAEFEQFLTLNGIRHVTSSPYHPASNGQAERAVQTVKKGVQKMQTGLLTDRLAKFLFTYRTTPHTTTGVPPAELLIGRNLQTHFHKLYPNRREDVEKHQAQQKRDHDKRAKRRHLQPGDYVFARNFSAQGDQWVAGRVERQTGPVSFRVALDGSNVLWRRHIDHLWPRIRSELPELREPELPVDTQSELVSSSATSDDPEPEPPQPSPQPVITPGVSPVAGESPSEATSPPPRRYPSRERRPPMRLQF